MKTLTLFFFIIFTATLTANAQITKGNWLVGGDASFFSNKSESELNGTISETSFLIISPNVGYFFIDKLAGGIDLRFSFVDPGKSVNSENYGFGPFLRYYFLKTDNLVNIFSQLNYNISFGKNGLGTRSKSIGYGFEIGTSLFFNNSVALEFFLSYDNTKNTLDRVDRRNTEQFLVGLGFQIHLEK
jgi:hypothetical protein